MRQRLMEEDFYRYVIVADPQLMRDTLWREWSAMNVFGRIYVAKEGINAQLSVPEHYYQAFRMKVDEHAELKDVPFKVAVEDDGKSFFRLTIKVREKIVRAQYLLGHRLASQFLRVRLGAPDQHQHW